MKKAKYITNPYIELSIIFFAIVVGIVVLFYKEISGAIACFCIALFWGIIFICLRKTFLSKMLIDEYGFKMFYMGNIIKQLNWEDIKDIKVRPNIKGGLIFFSNQPLYEGKEEWKNSKEFFVRVNSNFAIYLFKYKDKIPVPIRDFNKLPKSIQERLQK